MSSKYIRPFFHFISGSFIARLVSLIREILLAGFLGPSKILDIFFFIIAVPEFINQIWNRPLETILLKKYEYYIHKENKEIAQRKLADHIRNVVFASFLLYFLSSVLFPFIIFFFYNNFFSGYVAGAFFLINITLVVETYILSIKILKYSENDFFIPSIIPIFQSVTMVIGILFWEDRITLLRLSFLFAFGSLFQMIIIFRSEFRTVFSQIFKKIKMTFDKAVLKNTAQLSLAAGLSSLNVIIDQAFALNLGESANSYIHYGYYFLTIYSFLIVRNLNTIVFPQFQKYIVEKNHNKLISDIQKMIKLILIVSLVSCVLLINNGHFALKTLIGYGKVNEHDLLIIFYCTLGYAGAFLGTALNAMLVRVMHVYSEYNFLVFTSVINFTINIIFNFIFTKMFGVWGIAVSTSLAFITIVIIYFYYLFRKRHIKFFTNKSWYFRFFFLVLVVAAGESLALVYSVGFIDQSLVYNTVVFIVTLSLLLGIFTILRFINIKERKINF